MFAKFLNISIFHSNIFKTKLKIKNEKEKNTMDLNVLRTPINNNKRKKNLLQSNGAKSKLNTAFMPDYTSTPNQLVPKTSTPLIRKHCNPIKKKVKKVSYLHQNRYNSTFKDFEFNNGSTLNKLFINAKFSITHTHNYKSKIIFKNINRIRKERVIKSSTCTSTRVNYKCCCNCKQLTNNNLQLLQSNYLRQNI